MDHEADIKVPGEGHLPHQQAEPNQEVVCQQHAPGTETGTGVQAGNQISVQILTSCVGAGGPAAGVAPF